jgi:hypothetical protein
MLIRSDAQIRASHPRLSQRARNTAPLPGDGETVPTQSQRSGSADGACQTMIDRFLASLLEKMLRHQKCESRVPVHDGLLLT